MANKGNFQERSANKPNTTAGPTKATAAEQSQKGTELKDERVLKADELLAERNLTHEELLAEHQKTKKLLSASQTKNKDLLEAVRYRDRKIAKLGPGETGTAGKVVGSNTTDHSHLGEAKSTVEVPAQAKTAPKAKAEMPIKKEVAPKH